MPEQINFFEHAALEADIKSLVKEIQRHESLSENEGASGPELLKKAFRSLPPTTKKTAQTPAKDDTVSPLPVYAQDAPAEIRLEIEYLLDLAFHQGVLKAAAEAKKSPEFVQDAFHDSLAGRLYPELQRRGILK